MQKHMLIVAAFAASLGPASARTLDGYQRWINVFNLSATTIYSVHSTDIRTSHWGDDLLGPTVIPPGRVTRVEPTQQRGYCRYDLRVVFNDRIEWVGWNINLCAATALVCTGTGACHLH
jgi:hypothetical protein